MSLNNDTPKPTSNELIQISVPLTQKAGKKYWRGLDELADTKEFREWVTKEFPGGVDMLEGSSRRNVLKIMAASFGMAGLAACRRPMEHVLPASRGIEDFVPGQAYFYSSVFQHAGEAMGILVETHDGRPTKIEGNPQHPYSLGSSTVHAQASLLSMYDPDRAQKVAKDNNESGWDEFTGFVKSEFAPRLGQGDGLRFLSGRILSPSYRALKTSALKKYPNAKWVEYEPFAAENELSGTVAAFGQALTTHYHFDQANVTVALDSDFLGVDSGTVLPIKRWSKNRHLHEGATELNRLYAVESRHSLTGMNADHRTAAAIDGNSGVCRGSDGGGGRAGSERRRQAFQMDRRPGKGAECEQRQVDCHRGAEPAGGSSRALLCAEPAPWQHRPDPHLHKAGLRNGEYRRCGAQVAGGRNQRRPGKTVGDSGRKPGVHVALRPACRGRDQKGGDLYLCRRRSKRDLAARQMVAAGSALSRIAGATRSLRTEHLRSSSR